MDTTVVEGDLSDQDVFRNSGMASEKLKTDRAERSSDRYKRGTEGEYYGGQAIGNMGLSGAAR